MTYYFQLISGIFCNVIAQITKLTPHACKEFPLVYKQGTEKQMYG